MELCEIRVIVGVYKHFQYRSNMHPNIKILGKILVDSQMSPGKILYSSKRDGP